MKKKIELIKIDSLAKQRNRSTTNRSGPNKTTNTFHMVNCKFSDDNKHNEDDVKNIDASTYFDTQLNDNGNDDQQKDCPNISFRGRPMNGCKIHLPEDYSLAVVARDPNHENRLNAKCLSDQDVCYYWNLDKIPSLNDDMPQVVNWLNLANDIHSHVQIEKFVCQ